MVHDKMEPAPIAGRAESSPTLAIPPASLPRAAAAAAPPRHSIKTLECFTFCIAVVCSIIDAFGRVVICTEMLATCGEAFIPETYMYLIFGGTGAMVAIRQTAKGARGLMGVNKPPPAAGG